MSGFSIFVLVYSYGNCAGDCVVCGGGGIGVVCVLTGMEIASRGDWEKEEGGGFALVGMYGLRV